ncbi:MAG: hypothetical protein ACJ71Q_03505 [Terriglobales bacterium]|jgi:hypothetical protein
MKLMMTIMLAIACGIALAAQSGNSSQVSKPTNSTTQEKPSPKPHRGPRLSRTHPNYYDCQWQSDSQPGKVCVMSIEWLRSMPASDRYPIWLDHNDTVVWISTAGTQFVLTPFAGEDCKTHQRQDNKDPFDKDFRNDSPSTVKLARLTGKKGACWEHVIMVDKRPYLKGHRGSGDRDKDEGGARKETIDPHIFSGS